MPTYFAPSTMRHPEDGGPKPPLTSPYRSNSTMKPKTTLRTRRIRPSIINQIKVGDVLVPKANAPQGIPSALTVTRLAKNVAYGAKSSDYHLPRPNVQRHIVPTILCEVYSRARGKVVTVERTATALKHYEVYVPEVTDKGIE